MFVKQVSEVVKKDKSITIGDTLEIQLESKEKTRLKILAITGDMFTLEEVNNAGSIFMLNYKERDIRSVVLNRPQKVISIEYVDVTINTTKKLKSDLTYVVETKKIVETDMGVSDTFYFNKSQLCEIMYMSADKTLMVVKFVVSEKEVAIQHSDFIWLRNTNIKGRV